jgi:hypothetical protein
MSRWDAAQAALEASAAAHTAAEALFVRETLRGTWLELAEGERKPFSNTAGLPVIRGKVLMAWNGAIPHPEAFGAKEFARPVIFVLLDLGDTHGGVAVAVEKRAVPKVGTVVVIHKDDYVWATHAPRSSR